jgi:hypothetical protein
MLLSPLETSVPDPIILGFPDPNPKDNFDPAADPVPAYSVEYFMLTN